VNFVNESALNYPEFEALLEAKENEYDEIVYHTNVRWLNQGSASKQFSDLLNEIKLFMEKNGRNAEEFNDEERITDIAFLVDVTGHLNKLNKELQGKDKLTTDMNVNIKAFKVKLQLWENRLKPALKSLDNIVSELIQDDSQAIFLI
jgi:hypothetical protein